MKALLYYPWTPDYPQGPAHHPTLESKPTGNEGESSSPGSYAVSGRGTSLMETSKTWPGREILLRLERMSLIQPLSKR